MEDLRLINMADVPAEKIDFLWEPYIAYRKITIVQGDPGEGKTTMMLAIAAALTRGESISWDGSKQTPGNVIFQSAEDGLADTIKPRLAQLGADCKRVDVIDEEEKALSIIDERIERAMARTGAKLLILDPIQGYLGGKEMNTANSIRPMMKRLAAVAETTGAAIVLIGHLNKNTDSKSLYRGLGSIDIPAAARSVLTVGRFPRVDENTRAFIQTKSNLAPTGKPQSFVLDPKSGFHWLGGCNVTIKELLDGKAQENGGASQLALAEAFIGGLLAYGDVPASDVFAKSEAAGFSESTMKRAKSEMEIKSVKRGSEWYWVAKHKQGHQETQGSCQVQKSTVSNDIEAVDTLPVIKQKPQEFQGVQPQESVNSTVETDETLDTLPAGNEIQEAQQFSQISDDEIVDPLDTLPAGRESQKPDSLDILPMQTTQNQGPHKSRSARRREKRRKARAAAAAATTDTVNHANVHAPVSDRTAVSV